MSRDEVDPPCPQRAVVVLVGRHEEEGREGDDFPAREKHPCVAGHRQEREAGRHDSGERAELPAVLRVARFLPVALAVNRTEARNDEDGHEKKRREAVEREAHGPARQGPREPRRYGVAGQGPCGGGGAGGAAEDVQNGRDPLCRLRPRREEDPGSPLNAARAAATASSSRLVIPSTPGERAPPVSRRRTFGGARGLDHPRSRRTALDRITEGRIAEEVCDLRQHLQVGAGRRADEKEQREDPLAVRRREIDRLSQETERERNLVRGEGDRVPHVRDRDPVADRHHSPRIASEEEMEKRLAVSFVLELQQRDDRPEGLFASRAGDTVEDPAAFEALGHRRDALVLLVLVEERRGDGDVPPGRPLEELAPVDPELIVDPVRRQVAGLDPLNPLLPHLIMPAHRDVQDSDVIAGGFFAIA